jgi:hypothetical protein
LRSAASRRAATRMTAAPAIWPGSRSEA